MFFTNVDFYIPHDKQVPNIIMNTARIDDALPNSKHPLEEVAMSVVL